MRKYRFLTAIIAFVATALPAGAAPDNGCWEEEDGCLFTDTYHDDLGWTRWTVQCDDGFYDSGAERGDKTGTICE